MKLNIYKSFLLSLAAVLFTVSSTFAAPPPATQNSSIADGLFSNPATWSLGHVPLSTEEVIISHHVIFDQDFIVEQGLTVQAGASLIDNGNHTLQVGQSSGNNYVGITIDGILEVGNLILVKSVSTVTSNGSITVYNDFTTYIDGDMTINGTVQVGGNWNLSNGNVVTDGAGMLNIDGCLDNSGGGQITNIEVTFCAVNQGSCTVGPTLEELQALGNFDCGPLPTRITRTEATYNMQDDEITVMWETSFEENNAHFIVERSRDGVNFNEVELVEAEGDSKSIKTYEVVDYSPINGKSYYRIVQMDLDGTTHYSELVKINTNQNSNVLKAYPNPMTSNSLRLDFSYKNEAADIFVYNIDGQIIYEEHLTESDNMYATHQIEINTDFDMAIVQVIQHNEVYSMKVFKK